jgi:hypothetical protein
MEPAYRKWPFTIIPTRSHRVSTSGIIWVLKKMVLPCCWRLRMISATRCRPIGSRPLIGSSNIKSSGSSNNAAIIPIFWTMPLENPFICLSATSCMDNNSSNSFVRAPIFLLSILHIVPTSLKSSLGVR